MNAGCPLNFPARDPVMLYVKWSVVNCSADMTVDVDSAW